MFRYAIFFIAAYVPLSFSMDKLLKFIDKDQQVNSVLRVITNGLPVQEFKTIDAKRLKAKIDAKVGEDEETLLHVAIKNNRLDIVKELVSLGAEHKKNKWGEYPIHYAAFFDYAILEYFCSIKIPLTTLDKKNQTPLFFVRDFKSLKLLVDRGLSLTDMNTFGQIPIFQMLKNNAEKDAINYMIAYIKAIEKLRDNDNNSLLHYAAEFTDGFWIEKFLAMGIPINIQNRKGDSPLLRAIEGNNVKGAIYLMRRQASFDQENTVGEKPLHKAATRSAELVKVLLIAGANPNVRYQSLTPLALALQAKNQEAVAWLLAAGADPRLLEAIHLEAEEKRMLQSYNTPQNLVKYKAELVPQSVQFVQQENRASLVHMAVKDDPKKIPSLLASGVSINCLDANQETPLHWAIRERNQGAVEILVAHGASLVLRNRDGYSAVFLAIKHFPAIYDFLISRGLPFEVKGPNGMTHMHLAAFYSFPILIKLVQSGQSIESTNESGRTPIFYAIEAENLQALNFLISRGAKLDQENREGETPLIRAATKKAFIVDRLLVAHAPLTSKLGKTTPLHAAIQSPDAEQNIRILLNAGLTIDSRDFRGQTPLMLAAKERADLIEFLVNTCNADLEIVDSNQNRALHHAARSDNADSVGKLIELGATTDVRNHLDATPCALAAHDNCKNALRILKKYASPEDREMMDIYAKVPPLHQAIGRGDINKVRQIIEESRSLLNSHGNANIRGPLERTGMHVAAMRSPQLIRELFQMGADLDAIDFNGDMPLHCAAVCNPASTKIFIELKAKLNGQNKERNTPAHYAAMSNVATLRLLVEAGADLSLTNTKGQSVIDVAILMDKPDCAQYLLLNS